DSGCPRTTKWVHLVYCIALPIVEHSRQCSWGDSSNEAPPATGGRNGSALQWAVVFMVYRRGRQLQKRRPFEAPFRAQGKQAALRRNSGQAALQMRHVSSGECTGRKNEEGLDWALLHH